jgi:hypothetical protein
MEEVEGYSKRRLSRSTKKNRHALIQGIYKLKRPQATPQSRFRIEYQ